jgi:maltose O-acetyltransferase
MIGNLRAWARSPDFPLWRALAIVIEIPSQWRISRVVQFAVRQNRWRRRLASVGQSTIIYRNVVIHVPERVRIGNNAAIAEFVHIWGGGGVTIGDNVMIASHVVITSQTHDTASTTRRVNIEKPVWIENNAWIGAGAIILPGVTVGENAIVAAGAVVISDVPRDVIVAGVPARVIKDVLSLGRC